MDGFDVRCANQKLWGVYVLRVPSGMVKIGVSRNPKTRVKELQTGNPEPIQIVYVLFLSSPVLAYGVEEILHTRYGDSRGLGEWFKCDADEVAKDIKMAVSFTLLVQKSEPSTVQYKFESSATESTDDAMSLLTFEAAARFVF